MSARTTSRALGWLIGLLLLVCWNLQAEVRLKFTETDSIQTSKSFREPNTAIDPPPINLTATVGVPFEQALPFVKPTEGLVSISITGLPANGLHYADLGGGPGPGIQGVPLTSGVMNLTLLVNNGFPGMSWRPISLTVNPDPNPPIDPDPHPPINLTATVGLPFQQALPFVKPTEGLVSISITGLPANGLHYADLGGGPGPGIQGVPLTSGVMNLTLLVNNGFPGMSWRPISLTVNPDPNPPIDPDPHPPINLTATVGLPFEQALPFVIPSEGLVSISITGLPANGLHYADLGSPSPGIQGIPLTSGVMNLTLLVNNGFPGMSWRPISLTVNPTLPISLTATVGVPFQQTLPYLVPPIRIVSQAVTGLPANGLQFETSGTPGIQGVPLTSGVMNLTLLNGLATGTAWRPITITVNPSATSFAITGVNQISCQTISATQRQLTFTPQYVGTTGQPIIFTVYQQLPFTTQPGPYSLNLDTSNPLITLIAQQNGILASYNYQWLAACNTTTTPNRPPTTTGIPNQTAQPGQAYQLTLANYFNDPDGNPLTYIVSGLPSPLTLTGVIISGTPASTGSFPISVTAVDPGGLFVSTSFQLTVNGTTPPTQPFTLVGVTTNGCQNLGGNQWQVTFTPQYTGLTGEQIVMAMTNGVITTQAGPYSQTLSTDKPLLTLIAQQGNTTSSYNYFWLAACNGGARQPASEVGNGLQVKVFGNPVQSQEVEVEISGVIGRWVEVTVMDLQGRSHHQQRLDWPTDGGRINLPVGQGVGTHLIQVRTEGQVQTVKIIKSR